jgi:hypothetical protein
MSRRNCRRYANAASLSVVAVLRAGWAFGQPQPFQSIIVLERVALAHDG